MKCIGEKIDMGKGKIHTHTTYTYGLVDNGLGNEGYIKINLAATERGRTLLITNATCIDLWVFIGCLDFERLDNYIWF